VIDLEVNEIKDQDYSSSEPQKFNCIDHYNRKALGTEIGDQHFFYF
jgi:hypothetical protein